MNTALILAPLPEPLSCYSPTLPARPPQAGCTPARAVLAASVLAIAIGWERERESREIESERETGEGGNDGGMEREQRDGWI